MTSRISQLTAAGTATGNELVEVSQLSTTVTLTATDISALAADNSYNSVAAAFITAGFAVNDAVKVTGFTGNAANNIFSGVITVLTAGKMTIGGTDGDVIVDDAAGESVTITRWNSRRMLKSDFAGFGGGLTFTSDTGSTADSDPGAGLFKWNHATQASSTFLYFDDVTADSSASDLSTFFASLGSTGFIHIVNAANEAQFQVWKWTATPTDGTGYWKFAVTLQTSVSLADAVTCKVLFIGAGGGSGSTQGRHSMWIPAGAMRPSITGGCAALEGFETTSGRPEIEGLAFDQAVEEYAQFTHRMPKLWDEGTLTFVPALAQVAAGAGDTVWGLQAVACSNDDTLDAAYGTAQEVTDTLGTAEDIYFGPESSAITVAGSPAAEDLVAFRVYRKSASGSDTLAIDAWLIGVTIYYTTNADTDA